MIKMNKERNNYIIKPRKYSNGIIKKNTSKKDLIKKNLSKHDLELTKEGLLWKGEILISNSYAKIIQENTYLIGKVTEKRVLCKCINVKQCIEEVVEIKVEDLEKEIIAKLQCVMGYNFYLKQGKRYKELFLESIRACSTNYNKKNIYTDLGWHRQNDKWFYVHGDGVIGVKDELSKDYFVDDSIKEYKIHHDDEYDEKEAYCSILNMLDIADSKITIPLLANTMTALIYTFLNEADIEPRYIMWLHGETGSRKTTIAHLMAHIFSKHSRNIPASFKDTKASLECKAHEFKDCALIIDDYHPSTNRDEKKEMESKAHHIIRLRGDSIGKGRRTQTLEKQIEYKPRGTLLVTGEDFITGHSASVRCVSIEIKRNDIDLIALTNSQKEVDLISTGIFQYINWLAKSGDKIIAKSGHIFNQKRKGMSNSFSHGRMDESIIMLVMGIDMFLRYGYDIKAISKHKKKKLRKKVHNTLISVMDNQDKYVRYNNPVFMYLSALQTMIDSGNININNIGICGGKNIAGYQDDNYYYMIPGNLYSQVLSYWRSQEIKFPLSSKKIHEMLESEGIIKVSNNDSKRSHRTKKTSIDSSTRIRTLWINKSQMKKYLDDHI